MANSGSDASDASDASEWADTLPIAEEAVYEF